MKWFNAEPDISRREMIPVEENWNCPTVGCCGVMAATGERWLTATPGLPNRPKTRSSKRHGTKPSKSCTVETS